MLRGTCARSIAARLVLGLVLGLGLFAAISTLPGTWETAYAQCLCHSNEREGKEKYADESAAAPTANQLYVMQVYRDLFGREIDPALLRIWVEWLEQGTSREDLVWLILNSEEYRANQIDGIYRHHLDRPPDPSELLRELRRLQDLDVTIEVRFVSLGPVTERILGSDEFFTHTGGTSAQFVDGLYQGLLGRVPGPDERKVWEDQLVGGAPRDVVVGGLLNSSEHRGLQVNDAFQHMLRRPPSMDEHDFWVKGLIANHSREHMVERILISPEYVAAVVSPPAPEGIAAGVTAPVAPTANEHFIDEVHFRLLGEPIDPASRQYWAQRLDEGASHEQIVLEILHGYQYRANRVQDVFEELLRRAPTGAELQRSVDLLEGGGQLEEVERSVLGSEEYFDGAGGTNAQFVIALYQKLLQRQPDPTELAYWEEQLAAGRSRGDVASDVLNSRERHGLLLDKIFLSLLHRNISVQERQQLVVIITPRLVIERDVATSAEFIDSATD